MRHRLYKGILLLTAGLSIEALGRAQTAPNFTPPSKPLPDRYKQQGRYEGQVQRAELLTRTQGWALSDTQLMFTNDAGESWKEITPAAAVSGSTIVDVFFSNPEQGWVLLVKDTPENDSWSLVLSETSDQGGTWQNIPVFGIPATATEGYGGGAYLDFVTTEYGWLLLHNPSSSAFNSGTLYETENGGRTWQKLPQAGAYGAPHFQVDGMGYITAAPDGPDGYELYRFKNGGRTWAKLKLPNIADADRYHDSLSEPYVREGQVTLMRTVTHTDQDDTVEVLRSEDEGTTWKVVEKLTTPSDNRAATTVTADGHEIVQAFSSTNGSLTIRDGSADHVAILPHSWTMTASSKVSVAALSFPNAQTGWLLVNKWQCGLVGCTSGQFLLRTEDGGNTVQAISAPFHTKVVWMDRRQRVVPKPVRPAVPVP